MLPTQIMSNKLEVYREYRREDDKPLSETKLGQKVKVVLRLRATLADSVKNVAIVDLLPGGFEVEMLNPGTPNPIAAAGSSLNADYVDVREDRVLVFTSADSAVHDFVYYINPTNRGQYVVPPIYAEAMYDRMAQASGLPGKIEVKE